MKYGSVALLGLVIPASGLQAEHDKENQTALRHCSRASEIIGMEVRNLQDEKLGKIDDLVINLQNGEISYAILSSGGVLGIGDKLVPVPAGGFSYASSEKKLILDTDKKTLEGAMPFANSDWPDVSKPDWDAPYRSYYQNTTLADRKNTETFAYRQSIKEGEKAAVDPARRDVRTTADGARDLDVTPQDQGGTEAERMTTANIKKAFMDDKGHSANWKNIKVTTSNGTITLRGSVPTQLEKNEILAIAKKHAGSHAVSDQIEIRLE